ncbi:signal peptidase I [Duganella sp. FT27W]|uniref:signal peptidase I n=1 Tax=Duganella sp. FT27W TaxID=2654636 RepID=UPI00186B9F5F
MLAFFMPLLGFLYLGRPGLAVLVFVLQLGLAGIGFTLPGSAIMGMASLVFAVASAVLAYQLASRADRAKAMPQPWYARWYGLIGVVAAMAIVLVSVRMFVVEPFTAPSTSMAPTVAVGANLVVQKWGYGHYSTYGAKLITRAPSVAPERGDVIVFDGPREPSDVFVKRVVGVPGDVVEYRDKHVLINGGDTRGQRREDYLDKDQVKYLQRYRERLGQSEHDIVINPEAAPIYHDQQNGLPPDCVSANGILRCRVPAGAYFVMGDNRDNSMDSRYWGFVHASAIVGKVVAVLPPKP